MAIIQQFSYDEKKINSYKELKGLTNNCLWEVTNKKSYDTYKNLIKKNIIYKYNKTNRIMIRIKSDIPILNM